MTLTRTVALALSALAIMAMVGASLPDSAAAGDVGLSVGFGSHGHGGHHRKHWRHHGHHKHSGHHKHWRHHGHGRHRGHHHHHDRAPAGYENETPWVDPDAGYANAATPTRTYRDPDGRYCREFTRTVLINGRQQEAYGRACQQPDGSWEIVN